MIRDFSIKKLGYQNASENKNYVVDNQQNQENLNEYINNNIESRD